MRLLADPAQFYLAAPEPIRRLMLQELFERIWIRDQELVGGDLNLQYAELFGVAAAHAARLAGDGDADGHLTFFRGAGERNAVYLRAERPFGPLEVDKRRTPVSYESRSSNLNALVGLPGHNLTTGLAASLARYPRSQAALRSPQLPRSWRFVSRLALEVIIDILKRYQSGASSRHLAKEYGVGKNTILRLLRSHEVVREPYHH